MTVDHIDVDVTLKTVQQLLAEEAHLSPALRSILEVMIVLVKLMANRLSLNSRNSSQPPSTDRFAKGDKTDKEGSGKKSGGQSGRVGTAVRRIKLGLVRWIREAIHHRWLLMYPRRLILRLVWVLADCRCAPNPPYAYPLNSKVRTNKGERGIWQRRFWEHAVRDERDYANHIDYVHVNPLKHGYVTRVKDWPYSSFHRYVRKGVLPADWAADSAFDAKTDFGERL